MCAVIPVAALRFETFELLEEESMDRLATRRRAAQIEYGWELDASEIPELDLDRQIEARNRDTIEPLSQRLLRAG